MTDKGRQPPTIDKTLAKLRAAFNRGQRLGLVTDNPFAKFKIRNAGRAKVSVIRSREEIRKLKAEAPSAWWRSLIGLWFTGLRRDEALQLERPQIDFEKGEVSINRGNGGSFVHDGTTYPILAWEPKTERSCRSVPIAPDTMAVLRQLHQQSNGNVYAFLSLDRLRTIQTRVDAGSWRPDAELSWSTTYCGTSRAYSGAYWAMTSMWRPSMIHAKRSAPICPMSSRFRRSLKSWATRRRC